MHDASLVPSAVPYSGATRVVFIVGDPVAQVKAPAGLTRYFRELGHDRVVVPAHVAPADFAAFVASVERMANADGLIVTVPHKFAAHALCAEVTAAAARVGSVNLMRRHPAGGWFGAMTDGDACLRSLCSRGFRPQGARALIVGAGGAGVAVADTLVRAGVASLHVHDLDAARGRRLVEILRKGTGFAVDLAGADPTGFDLVVNATLLGTQADDPLPFDPGRLAPTSFVADLACGPGSTTALVQAAAARGCTTMTGDEMFDTACGMLADFFLEPHDATPVDEHRRSEPAAERLRALLNGYQATQAIHVAAMLGVADHLGCEPQSIDRLAAAVGADRDALYRLLRALAALGVLREHEGHAFSLTLMGAWLRSDAEPSLRPWAMFVAEPSRWKTWGHLLHSVRTGENAFRALHGIDSWEYRRRHPQQAALFHAAMTANSARIDQAVVAACDVGGRRHLGDVGGGRGSLLASFLASHPEMRGTLLDRPETIDGARSHLAAAGVLDRCRLVGGDMFTDVPTGCDALVLKFILHDWGDADALAILRSCRRAVDSGALLFVVEYQIEAPNQGLYAKMSDLNMLVGPGGRERSAAEYHELLRAAGFVPRRSAVVAGPLHALVAEAS